LGIRLPLTAFSFVVRKLPPSCPEVGTQKHRFCSLPVFLSSPNQLDQGWRRFPELGQPQYGKKQNQAWPVKVSFSSTRVNQLFGAVERNIKKAIFPTTPLLQSNCNSNMFAVSGRKAFPAFPRQ
jgi:hypothetical protein